MVDKIQFERSLVWFRNDLRVHDNTALHRAVSSSRNVAAIFIACPQTWRDHDEGDKLVAFRLACLRELQQNLSERNIPLYFLQLNDFGEVPKALQKIAKKLEIDALFANAEYPFNERRRDDSVRVALKEINVPAEYSTDRTLVPPGAVKTGGGEPYKVFTPF